MTARSMVEVSGLKVGPDPITRAPIFRDHPERSSPASLILGWGIYGAAVILLLLLIRPLSATHAATVTFVSLGIIGIWRWSWGCLHLVRSIIYRHLIFPGIRARADAAAKPPQLFILITSYRIAAELNHAVYQRVLEEVASFGVPTTLVACITDQADVTLISDLVRRATNLPTGTSIVFIPQAGKGKRHAMGEALRLMRQQHPEPGAQVILMDGDSILGRDVLARSCAVLSAEADLGAVTTENIPWVKGTGLVREWYRLRMAQRHSFMCSLSLSRKLLVLTGRFSVFRADIATSTDFILGIEQDSIRHWRLGRIRMLTGDDKSSWYAVLRRGWNMLYIPDAVIHPVEELPAGNVLSATTALMTRWYGNMVRSNGRAIGLGPRHCGLFPWICFIDQRLSTWTALIGPVSTIVLAFHYGGMVILWYLLWVLVSRGLVCAALGATTGRFHPLFPLILYYGQVVGSLIKIRVGFRPHKQRWTRQKVSAGAEDAAAVVRDFSSDLFSYVVILVVLMAITLYAVG
jgi:mannuronan synthase